MAKEYYVYLHTFPDGKRYVGITSMKPERRWNKGRGYRRRIKGRYTQKAMAYATLKNDWDSIKHEVLASGLTREEAREIESRLIAEYRSNEPEYGYNIAL